jgi:flavin-dependent dehydrogenase
MSDLQFDVAIIGGGPGGSTCGGFLKKYAPRLKIGIFERAKFPRDHIGESQLPIIGAILDELGAWEKVEAAEFPIKVGGTYLWGKDEGLWDFHFVPNGELQDEPRPAPYAGQRKETALQVDRAIYDEILLNHARELGCEVFEETAVAQVEVEDARVLGLALKDGRNVTAKFYVDATGHIGILRRAVGVPVEIPSNLKNVAFWDYWQNAEWAVKIGIGGTRIQVMSVGNGWLWFIPLGPTRTSIGFVCPAEYYKKSGLRPEELYMKAIQDQPRIAALVKSGEREMKFDTTKDWSFLASEMAGQNWMLVGESAGFADPILSAGLTITHSSAREAAFTMIEVLKGGDQAWLNEAFTSRNRRRILQHIRFADYWYSANAHFSELKQYTREIAMDAGLDLDPEAAFRWLGTGGFIEEDVGVGGFGTVGFNALHQIMNRMTTSGGESPYHGMNHFRLDLSGADSYKIANFDKGRVLPITAYERDGKVLPLSGMVGRVVHALQASPDINEALFAMAAGMKRAGIPPNPGMLEGVLQSLEALIRDGWVSASYNPKRPLMPASMPKSSRFIQDNRDASLPKQRRASALFDG